MKIAISNIAWERDKDDAVVEIMHDFGVKGVEIAPTKVWDTPLAASDSELAAYRRWWESRGIEIVAMQALLFGRPDLTIFNSAEKRQETLAYLAGMIRLAGRLGARVLVFGSPRNRRVDSLPGREVESISAAFFTALGRIAVQHDVAFCIEPNPVAYGCDFVTTCEEGLALVRRLDSRGVGLHLDAGAMTLSHEDAERSIRRARGAIEHFHASEAHLAPVGSGSVDHQRFASTLRQIGYDHWVSVEMRAAEGPHQLSRVRDALSLVTAVYG